MLMSDVSFSVTRTSEPESAPLSLDEVKSHLRIDASDEDALLETYIQAATRDAELICDRQLMPATYVLRLDAFPCEIRLPKPPCISVTSIQYVDTAGETQTLATSEYAVDTFTQPARIVPAYGKSWPSTRCQPNAVTVTYVAGYASAAAIPATLRLGMLHLIAHWYENREPVNIGNIVNPLPSVGEMLIRQHWHGYVW